jgi:DNA helicase-4
MKYISRKENKLTEEQRIKNNNEFINEKLISLKAYFDNMYKDIDSNIMLDTEQRIAILTDEDYNMIIAGAGSGKTTTISGKVKYLVDIKKIDPKDIIVISFTNKAVLELKNRINNDFKIDCKICTFHKFGLDIINDKNLKILSNPYNIVSYFFENILCNDNDTLYDLIKYFNYYFNIPNFILNFKSIDEYLKYKKKFSIFLYKDFYKNIQNKLKTIKGEEVTLFEHLLICNYLYINNINYIYTKDYIKIIQNDNIIYLKYLNGKPFFKSKNKYITFYYKSNLEKELEELLINNNFKLNKRKNSEVFKTLIDNNKDIYYNKFIYFCINFIEQLKIKEIDINNIKPKDEKDKLFLNFISKLYIYYKNYLETNNYLDFEDIITKATLKSNKLNYKYIIIDEYQDISIQRFNLIKKISDLNNSKIIVVGDDFQAIYSFSGSELSLFTDFNKMVGYFSLLKITHTYRNSQNLINIAGNFIMKNDKQIKKNLISNKKCKYPVIIVYYKKCVEKLNYCINEIVKEYGLNKNILLLGRYNFDINNYLSKYYKKVNDKIIYSIYPSLDITFLSIHSSKGLGFDNVIILNCNDELYGFPSKVLTDSVMNLLNISSNDYNEERRLFYVALTRTKNKVYILSDKSKKSIFLKELEKYNDVLLK